MLSDIKAFGFSKISPFKIGQVENRMKSFATQNGITLGSNDVYMSSASIAHTTRDSKVDKGLSVSESDLQGFPKNRLKMDLYYDTRSKNFTYTDGKTKYVVHPNYSIKLENGRSKVVNFITASKVTDKYEFNMKEYEKI